MKRRLGRRRPGCRSTPGIRSQDCGVGAHGWPPSARNRVPKGGSEKRTAAEKREYIRHCRPRGVSIALRHRGIVVNAKKIRRLMREHALNPKQRRRFVATTDSDHNYPIFPNLAKNIKLDGPNQLWVADITYVTIATGFVYLAAILDAWSRRVVGYAISRSIDARLAVAALKAAISARNAPRVVCIIPIVGRSMPPKTIAPSCKSTVSPAPWAGAAIPTTTPRPRAS